MAETLKTALKRGAILSLGMILLVALGGCFLNRNQGSSVSGPAPQPVRPAAAPAQPAAAAASQPADPPKVVELPAEGPLRISLAQAGLAALENNRSLVVEKLKPTILETYEGQALAAFDPVLQGEISLGRSQSKRISSSTGAIVDSDSTSFEAQLSLQKFFPSGAFVEVGLGNQISDSSQYQNPLYANRLGVSANQPLLQGRGDEINLVQVRQARLDVTIGEYELRAFIETLLSEVEKAYWDYALAQRQIEIVEESLRLARQQMSDTQEMIRVGSMAESELAAVQAEVASQKQGLINARSALEKNRLRLLRLLNPPGQGMWGRKIELVHPPALPSNGLEGVELHVAQALLRRPEMNAAKLRISRNELELVRTKNGLLPRLDVFLTLGKSGYSDSFGSSLSDLPEESFDALMGLGLEYPLFNREAKARHRRSLLQKEQTQKALDNLAQLVELDIRQAYVEVERTRQQIEAGTATRLLEEEKLRVETEKFKVGRSTNFFVAQAQRDLLLSRISEVQALVDHLKARTEFYRLEGTLLTRRSISAPGAIPTEP